MGAEQFAQTMRGTGGVLQTATSGVVETDNYSTGGAATASATGDYPLALNPAATMQEIVVTQNHADLTVEIHTTGGDVFNAFENGVTGVRDKWEVDKIVVSDPNGTGASFALEWAGE